MNWQDILLERQFLKTVLKQALATAFDVPSAEVSIVDSIEEARSGVPILAEQTPTKGDFRCLLSLYIVEALASRDPVEVTRRLCKILNVQALVSSKSPNPYSMILIDQAAKTRLVTLDAKSLDQSEEYRLSKEALDYD